MVTQEGHYGRRGHPSLSQPPERIAYWLSGRWLGEVVEDALEVYKSLGRGVERGVRFLKAPLFFAESFFHKKPSRLMALRVMGLGLLVYTQADGLLRGDLERCEETVLDQKGQPTNRSTMRRVFLMFEGITVLSIVRSQGIEVQVLPLTPVQRQVIRLLGREVANCYDLLL